MQESRTSIASGLPGLALLALLAGYALVRIPLAPAETEMLSGLVDTPWAGPFQRLWLQLGASLPAHTVWPRVPAYAGALVAMLAALRFARETGGTHAVTGTLLLVAACPLAVALSSQANPASLQWLVVLVWLLAFVEVARTGDVRWYGVWLAAGLLAMGVHALAWMALLIQWLLALVYGRRYRLRPRLWWPLQLVPAAAGVAIYALAANAKGALLGQGATPGLFGWSRCTDAVDSLVTGQVWHDDAALLAALAVPVLVGLVSCADWHRNPRHGLLLLCLLGPGLAVPVGLHTTPLWPLTAACVLAAMGLRVLPRWLKQLLWALIATTCLWTWWDLLR